MNDLVGRLRQGDRRAVARALTRVERGAGDAREVVSAIYGDTGNAHVVGITGPPGSGKSTLVNEIAKCLRQDVAQVGIIAVDPSSPFTGGALLGDRIRMRDLSGDSGIFIRSMASRGNLGGLAQATAGAVKVLDAAGFDVILVETVGAGQAEVDIARLAHTTVVIEAPGMGDEIQSIKAGILEIADMLVVNKADHPGAANTVKALRMMLHMGQRTQARQKARWIDSGGATGATADEDDGDGDVWTVDVFETVATDGRGVAEVTRAIARHRVYLKESGEWLEREKDRSRQEIEQLLEMNLFERVRAAVPVGERERLIVAVAAREMDPYSAARSLFRRVEEGR